MTAKKNGSSRILDLVLGAWLPSWVFLGSYVVTTVLGSTVLLTASGRARLDTFLGRPEASPASIGSPEYYALLYLPLLLVPLFAFLGMRLFSRSDRGPRPALGDLRIPASQPVLVAMALAAGGYCVLRLAWLGRLVPQALLSSTATYEQRIIERTEAIEALGFGFYVATYAVLPTITACFLARFILGGKRRTDGVCMLVSYVGCHYLCFATLMKAPFVLLALLLGATVVIARASRLYLVILGGVCAVALLCMQLLLGGFVLPKVPAFERVEVQSEAEPDREALVEEGAVASPDTVPLASDGHATASAGASSGVDPAEPVSEEPASIVSPSRASRRLVGRAVVSIGTSVVFRMASSFPFYVDVFSDPAERCGIETNHLPLLPRPRCVLPTKVFDEMYPGVNWVQGYAPAPAHVSAYGELGLGYALLIMALSGLALGALGKVGQVGAGPLFVVFNAVVCMFAYYLAQVPFVGALSYSSGLIAYLLPLAALVLSSTLRRRFSSTRRA